MRLLRVPNGCFLRITAEILIFDGAYDIIKEESNFIS